jgi:3-phenylpropionate/cinnamic acid dioxygenase small subunit
VPSVSDEAAVAALVHRYAELLDGGDLDGVAALFERASWRSEGRPEVLEGTAQVRRAYDIVRLYDGKPRTRHVITNLTIEVDDGGVTATSRSYFTVFQAVPDLPLQPIIAGSYHDRFGRDEGGWFFTDRLIVTELTGDLSHHLVRLPR